MDFWGPPFNGHDFLNFSMYLDFTHKHKTPKNLQANAEAEQFMWVLKKLYHICDPPRENQQKGVNTGTRAMHGHASMTTDTDMCIFN